MDLQGKKLLVLGAADSVAKTPNLCYSSEIDIVNYAHEMGLYVIVADSQTNWNLAPAKKIADEGWDISWSDIDTLSKKCIEEKVDGVIAGFSEKRVFNAAKLCAVLGKPFYTDGADLDTIFNKAFFMNICQKSHVDIPKQYNDYQEIEYPVVVKPVDNAGCRGVVTCKNKQEFDIGIQDSLKYSNSKTVLVEEFVDGDQIIVYFFIENGKPYFLLTLDALFLYQGEKDFEKNFCLSYPSRRHHSRVIATQYLQSFERLIQNLNIQNGFIGFQCLVTPDRIVVHDPTFRIDGSRLSLVLRSEIGINEIEMLIYYSINGAFPSCNTIKCLGSEGLSKIYQSFFILLRPGVIGKINGISELKQIEGLLEVVPFKQTGDKVLDEDFRSSMFCRISLSADNKTDLKDKLCQVFDYIEVKDTVGNDLVIHPDLGVFLV